MKRFPFGLGIAVLCAALIAVMDDARAERPMAECNDGKCVVKEEDWKRFKEFWKRVEQYAKEMDAKATADLQAQYAQARKLESCLAQLEERKT